MNFRAAIRSAFQSVRYSALYPIYLRVFRNSIYKEYALEKNFYKNLLKYEKSVVFDIGANVGDKSALFLKCGCHVVTVEPDVNNCQLLRRRFLFNSKISIVQSAVSDRPGKELFYVSSPGSPINTLSEKWQKILNEEQANRWKKAIKFQEPYEVETITLDWLIEKYGKPYYIKIDVEGYEYQVLAGLSASVPVISFEANFPDFKNETVNCIRHLAEITTNVNFNILNDNFKFFWTAHQSAEFTIDWLEKTDEKYFEVFCFSETP